MPEAKTSKPHPRSKDLKPPNPDGDERSTLLGFLDYLREAVAGKLDGAPEPQVREPGVPSGTNLLGLVTHLTAVERSIFLGQGPTSWPKTFRPSADDTIDSVLAGYRDAVREANDALRYTAGNFYVNDKPTGSVVGAQPFGGARASGTNDKAGTVWNLIRFASPRSTKRNHLPVTDYHYPHLEA